MFAELLKSIIFGILEGITEWLPVSSTGHLILLGDILGGSAADELGEEFASAYGSMFDFVIQLGAICAVVIIFFDRLNFFSSKKSVDERRDTAWLYLKLVVASVPAVLAVFIGNALCERFFGSDIDGVFYNSFTVGCMLIVYGVLFIVAEKSCPLRWRKQSSDGSASGAKSEKKEWGEKREKREISLKDALFIGCFQALSVIPGTSRSGATILGARLCGIKRDTAAEFSFFLAIPAIGGASLLGVWDFVTYVQSSGTVVPWELYAYLAVACITAFAVSALTLKALIAFVKHHTFLPFAIYRIALGALVLLFC